MIPATSAKLRLAAKSFAVNLSFLAVVSIGGNCLASLYRRSDLPSWGELVVPAVIALLGAIVLTVLDQAMLWRNRIPQRRRPR